MNIKDDLYSMTFKDIAKEFNEFAKTVETMEDTDPSYIKNAIFNALKKEYPQLDMHYMDYDYNKFKIEIRYQHEFQGIKDYDKGSITLIFSIRAKRTKKLESVSETKKKYVHTNHDNPITFSYYAITSYTPSFEWASRKPEELYVKREGDLSNKGLEHVTKKQTIQELLDAIPATYLKEFRLQLVQPYVHAISVKRINDAKYKVIYNAAPSYVKEALDTNTNIFGAIADYIIEAKMFIA